MKYIVHVPIGDLPKAAAKEYVLEVKTKFAEAGFFSPTDKVVFFGSKDISMVEVFSLPSDPIPVPTNAINYYSERPATAAPGSF